MKPAHHTGAARKMEYVAIIQARKAAESKLQTLKEAVKLSNERARQAVGMGQPLDTANKLKEKKRDR